ncbi:peptide-methionine (R)-S-oxide reductase MsrB [uncultured Aquimarina sp.]|uniref:peptide-methionine (R)-S-oxide reductase MsrB n=1 Tax=uncultured Aquimarina sp. TaxID=575652 RepID=UPI002627FB06|nr:peptide-methionine (R)-S-oxide reductase MsrB [uncultured Aquimarina sp.]
MKKYPFYKTEEQWKKDLTEEEYRVLRQKGTERPFTGKYNIHSENGTYKCMACNTPLFESSSKFDSGCGWPSFDESIEGSIEYVRDTSHGMIRTEILCANCGSHLGHIFNDGPTETGQRYCVNSVSIDFDQSSQ